MSLEQSILVTCKQVKVGFDEFRAIDPCNMQTSKSGVDEFIMIKPFWDEFIMVESFWEGVIFIH
jgi:hypothetical protein